MNHIVFINYSAQEFPDNMLKVEVDGTLQDVSGNIPSGQALVHPTGGKDAARVFVGPTEILTPLQKFTINHVSYYLTIHPDNSSADHYYFVQITDKTAFVDLQCLVLANRSSANIESLEVKYINDTFFTDLGLTLGAGDIAVIQKTKNVITDFRIKISGAFPAFTDLAKLRPHDQDLGDPQDTVVGIEIANSTN